jgi:hypothetical protein
LKDPRFHEGFPVTIVAEGNMASEIHLGFAREHDEEKAEHAKTTKKEPRPTDKPEVPAQTRTSKKVSPADEDPRSVIKRRQAKKAAEEEDDNEIPGKIKSFDANKRILVVSLLNGNTRSFILAKNVQVEVGGTASKKGLDDPALKAGATVTVFTDDNGRKVKEVKVVKHSWFRRAG